MCTPLVEFPGLPSVANSQFFPRAFVNLMNFCRVNLNASISLIIFLVILSMVIEFGLKRKVPIVRI
jgi:hypothetical protein